MKLAIRILDTEVLAVELTRSDAAEAEDDEQEITMTRGSYEICPDEDEADYEPYEGESDRLHAFGFSR